MCSSQRYPAMAGSASCAHEFSGKNRSRAVSVWTTHTVWSDLIRWLDDVYVLLSVRLQHNIPRVFIDSVALEIAIERLIAAFKVVCCARW